MQLRNVVTRADVDEGLRLIKVATQQAATNPLTGQIDMDIISTGHSQTSKEKIMQVTTILKGILVSNFTSDFDRNPTSREQGWESVSKVSLMSLKDNLAVKWICQNTNLKTC